MKKLTIKNPNPCDGEPYFNLGSAYDDLGEYDSAYDSYFKAAWNAAWQDAAFYRIGCIDMRRGESELAMEHLTLALERNARNLKARGAMVVLLRESGRTDEAVSAAIPTT